MEKKEPELGKNDGDLSAVIKELLSYSATPHDTKQLSKKFEEALKANDSAKTNEIGVQIWRNFETTKLFALQESVDEKYRGVVVQMTETIYREMDIKSEMEKSIVEICVGSFVRYLDNSRRLNNNLNSETITPNKNQYIANLSKQVDRAHRQYLSSLQTLMQIKQPRLSLNIKAETAFIADKQQVNSVKPESHEINESK